jgi:hypothetical protein
MREHGRPILGDVFVKQNARLGATDYEVTARQVMRNTKGGLRAAPFLLASIPFRELEVPTDARSRVHAGW